MRKVVLMMLILCSFLVVSKGRETAVAQDRFTENNPLALGDTTRVSVDDNGVEGNDDSAAPDISADGRFVTFTSESDNLVIGDDNGAVDIFVHDRETGDTERVSEDSNGVEGNFDSFAPAISGDGRFVAFCSYATNLVPNDNNGVPDVFVNDRQTGETTLVSRDIFGGFGDDVSCYIHTNSPRRPSGPDISEDGRYVVFSSFATDLVGDDTNGSSDIFRLDRQTGMMERMSVDSNEAEANGDSFHPAISADGSRIVFESDASNLAPGDGNNYRDVFIRNLLTGNTNMMSVHTNLTIGNGDSFEPHISANGVLVVFSSFATNLVDGDDNNYLDVFIRDRDPDVTSLVSVSDTGEQPNVFAQTMEPSVAADGRFVVFQTFATNLADARAADTRDVVLRDRQEGTSTYASLSSSGEQGNDSSREPVLSDDGFYVVFSSFATNLVSGDTNGDEDIFVRQIQEEEEPPPPPPPPAPTLVGNFHIGEPGSVFAFTGDNYGQNQPVTLFVNNTYLGVVQSEFDGSIAFRLDTDSSTDLGAYYVLAVVGGQQAAALFFLKPDAPQWPPTGTSPIFDVPDGIAYGELRFLPIAPRR